MKITDLGLVFSAVILPMIIILYVNISFTIKAQEQEIYYKKLINIASQDASDQMKQVENEDITVDYGYSGSDNEKISVNAQVAVDTFLNNLYNNFGVSGNTTAERYLQLFVPAMAIIDYNGVQISSLEEYKKNGNSVIEHVLKPKTYYSYDYTIVKKTNDSSLSIVEGYTEENAISWHHIEFTMDDNITHTGSYIVPNAGNTIKSYEKKSFYITDEDLDNLGQPKNFELYGRYDMYGNHYPSNINSIGNDGITNDLIKNIEKTLKERRKEIIVNTVTKEITYAINKNNSFARSAGITYNFAFPTTTQEDMYATIENVGFLAFVQGINVGNKYLNAKAYNVTSLELTTRYYFSVPNENSKYKRNLYHRDTDCPEYKIATENVQKTLPSYVLSKQQASMQTIKVTFKDSVDKQFMGFYPCPICDP